jgi:subtilisin family serine protease
VRNEVLVELAASTTNQRAEEMARLYQLTSVESLDFGLAGTKLFRFQINDQREASAVVRQLQGAPGVISVGFNTVLKLQEGPDTVGVSAPAPRFEQYALAKLQMPQAHALATGEKVLVAIVDGGVDTTHPELAGVVVETFDAIGSGDQVHPHGTAVAGAIAAQVRIKGTAPSAQILAARAFGNDRASAEGTSYNIVKAINWAVSRNARIINLSFAGDHDPKVEVALRAARARGIVLVAAAGNDGPSSQPRYPAADANVIAVTATDQADQLFRAAVRGKHIAVAAPGVDLMLPGLDGTYRQISGTSFSAAEVSGTIALMLERQPNMGPETVRRTLMTTARDLGPKGVDTQFGAGLVDAYRALMAVTPQAISTNMRSGPTP